MPSLSLLCEAGPGAWCLPSPAAHRAHPAPRCHRPAAANLSSPMSPRCINMAMLLPGELRERRVPCGLFAQELGLLPPRRRCLQKKSQFPVVLDGAGSSLDAFPLLFILISSGAYCFCSRISAVVTMREVFCFLSFFFFSGTGQRAWFIEEFLAFGGGFIYIFPPCVRLCKCYCSL